MRNKYDELKDIIKNYGKLAVAFSGGVDSTFLLKTAHEVLGDNVLAVTAASGLIPSGELRDAKEFCRKEGIHHIVFDFDEFSVDNFENNPPDRCYMCKKSIFTEIINIAGSQEIENVAEGSNMNDEDDYRPGMKAIKELGVLSPLKSAGLFKDEIRVFSRELRLDTWDKPSFACLASRFPYGQKITEEKLRRVEKAEAYLMDKGFRQLRVRIHDNLARIEIPAEDFDAFADYRLREDINEYFKRLGFVYVSLDLAGYRTGSMNETLNSEG